MFRGFVFPNPYKKVVKILCILLVASKELPVAYQSKANSSNPDGCGVAKSFKEGLMVIKNYKGVVETHLLGSLTGDCKMTMTHYRIKTHGGNSTEEMLSNCHPFLIKDSAGGQLLIAGAHNGIFSEFGTCKTKSDTAVFFESISALIPVTEGTLVERTLAAQAFIEHILKEDSVENDLFKGRKVNLAAYVKSTGSKVGVIGIDGWKMIVNESSGTKEDSPEGFIWRSNGTCLVGGGYDVGGRSTTSYPGYGTGNYSGYSAGSKATTTHSTTAEVAGQSIYRATVEPDGTITVLATNGDKAVTDATGNKTTTKAADTASGDSTAVTDAGTVDTKTDEILDTDLLAQAANLLTFEADSNDDPNEKTRPEGNAEELAHAPIDGRVDLTVNRKATRVVKTTSPISDVG